MKNLRAGHLYISCEKRLELRYVPVMECQLGNMLEKLRDRVRY